ncbi:MAG: hypothetical protein J5644_01945 [Bacteroidales bacterium]|nr:hypothetical protein [Bacteroidales bacterium]
MQKKSFFILILALAIVLAGCAPKVVGKRKHKKIHGCGCELLHEQNDGQDATTAYFSEVADK